MGKLGDSPYEDPMEPWSGKYNAPVKNEEVESLDEDTWLFAYIRSLGYNPKVMDFAQRSKYARSNAFKHWKQSHMERRAGETATMEETEPVNEAGTGLLMTFIKAKGLNPLTMDGNQKHAYSRSSEFRVFKQKHQKEQVQETSGMGERGDDWNEATSSAQQAAIAIDMKKKGIKPKHVKEEADEADTVTMDIPLLIRVLEYAREDAKTDMDLHKLVENLIKMRDQGTLSMAQYDTIVKITEEIEKLQELKKMPDNMDADDHITREDLRQWFSKSHPEGDWKRINSKGEVAGPCAREPGEPKPKCMSKEKRAKLSKKERAAAVAAKRKYDPVADRAGKGGKPINVSNFGKGKLSEEQLDEKNKPTNPGLWSKAKSLARSKFDVYPSAYANGWASKWYKSKGGGWRATKEEVELQEEFKKGDKVRHNDGTLGTVTNGPDEQGIVQWKHAGNKHRASHKSVLKSAADEKFRWRQYKEEVETNENHIAIAMGKMLDDEGSMVLNQLDDIDRCSKMIRDYVGKDYEKQLPAWVQSKVTLAADYINTVGTYLASKNEDVKEEVVSESMPSGVTKIKQKYADMSAKEFAQNHGHKKDDELRAMAWRHGYGKNSNYYVDKKREGQGASKQVQEGIGNVEDSPQSATNSVKAMESAHRDRQMKSARMIKSLYKNKIKETTYDWEKDDKPNAKIVVKGGTTMTGQPRDTVEIEPVLKTRPNQQKPTV